MPQDSNGMGLQVGDLVTVTATVEEIVPDAEVCNVQLRVVPPAGCPGQDVAPQIIGNARLAALDLMGRDVVMKPNGRQGVVVGTFRKQTGIEYQVRYADDQGTVKDVWLRLDDIRLA